MKYIIILLTVVCVFLAGWFSHGILNEGEVREIKTVEYRTKWKVKKEGITYEKAIGYMFSPIIIDHRMYDNKIVVHAYDQIKENKKVVGFKCVSTDDWDLYFAVGAICIVAGVAGTLYLVR